MTLEPARFRLPHPGDLGPDPELPGSRRGAFHEGRTGGMAPPRAGRPPLAAATPPAPPAVPGLEIPAVAVREAA